MKRLLQNSYAAMLWKEVRENAVWAVLAALVLVGVNYYAGDIFYFTWNLVDNDGSAPMIRFLSSNAEPVVTQGVGPILAVILGIMQVLPEQRRDQWAFLMHRPLSHTAIFWHKIVAGLLLYTLSMGGAFLLLWYLKWLPIHQTVPEVPFDWRFMWGGIANLLLGIPFYFAAMLCVMRPARWYGSKFLPLFSCLVLHYYWFDIQEFYQCFWLVVIASIIFALAVWNSFAEKGQAPFKSRGGQIATGITLLSMLVPLVMYGVLVLATWISILTSNPDQIVAPARTSQITSSYYGVLDNGEVVRAVSWDSLKTRYFGLDGKEKNIRPSVLPGFQPIPYISDTPSFRKPGRYLSILEQYADRGQRIFNFPLYSAQISRILLFNEGNWKFAGYADVAGDVSKNHAYRELLRTNISGGYMWLSDGIYRLKANEAVLEPVSNARDIETIGFVGIPAKERKSGSRSSSRSIYAAADYSLVAARTKSIDVYDRNAKLLFSIVREHDSKLYPRIAIHVNHDRSRYYINYQSAPNIPNLKRRELPDYIVICDGKGNVLERHTLFRLRNNTDGGKHLNEVLTLGQGTAPIALVIYTARIFYGYAAFNLAPSLWLKQLVLDYPAYALMAWITFFAALVSCGVLWLLRWLSGLTRRSLRMWLLIVFLFGPAGLLLFFAMRGWPARVPCPSCGKLRAVDFDNCESCGAAWPVRLSDSADIFPVQ